MCFRLGLFLFNSSHSDPPQQFPRRLVVRILLDQLAADGEVEDGLAEGLDLVAAGGEWGEVVEGEGGMVTESGRIRIGCVEPCETRRGQPVPRRFPVGPRRRQLVAERLQFIDLGDDTVLFGKGWEGNRHPIHFVFRKSTAAYPRLLINYESLKI